MRSASLDSYASNPPHLNAMGVVHEPVEDAIGQRGISYLFCQRETGSCEVRIVESARAERGYLPSNHRPQTVSVMRITNDFAQGPPQTILRLRQVSLLPGHDAVHFTL